MEWEFVGKQELVFPVNSNRTYPYSVGVWRTRVAGGWLLLTVNVRSNDPQPTTSFYPDPDHAWQPIGPPEAQYLLRAAPSAASGDVARLLRPAEERLENE